MPLRGLNLHISPPGTPNRTSLSLITPEELQRPHLKSIKGVHRYWADEVLPYLYLGSAKDAHDLEGLNEHKITHILNCADDVADVFPGQFQYKRLEVKDFGEDEGISRVFQDACTYIDDIRRSNGKCRVLVHCFAGQNRSVTITIAALMLMNKENLLDTYKYVRSKRPRACPFLDNRVQLLEFEKTLYGGQNSMKVEDFYNMRNLRVDLRGVRIKEIPMSDDGRDSQDLDLMEGELGSSLGSVSESGHFMGELSLQPTPDGSCRSAFGSAFGSPPDKGFFEMSMSPGSIDPIELEGGQSGEGKR